MPGGLPGPSTVDYYVWSPEARARTELQPLHEATAALKAPAPLPAEDRERLLAQNLDTTSHRLDAWITSLATKRLAWLRRPGSSYRCGCHLGGYGWLLDVVPRAAQPPQVPVERRPEGEPLRPQGRLLAPGLPNAYDLFAEEVPREGVTLTRSHQYARARDGRSVLWTARRARPGRGEVQSGLRFDRAEE